MIAKSARRFRALMRRQTKVDQEEPTSQPTFDLMEPREKGLVLLCRLHNEIAIYCSKLGVGVPASMHDTDKLCDILAECERIESLIIDYKRKLDEHITDEQIDRFNSLAERTGNADLRIKK